jgi:RNA 3'-terminal phosphate cyclase (ATP)
MKSFLDIDGSQGEGGGQVFRTSLALALARGTPVRVHNIRAGRDKPGLLRQHLTAVRAIATISDSSVSGDEIGSREVELTPGRVRAGDYRFAVGTAGSTTLVLQTILLPLALTGEPSTVRIEGGTHNPFSPTFEFLQESYLPLLARMGVKAEARLLRHGFHPAGGGEIEVKLEGTGVRAPLDLVERGELVSRRARILLANLPERIGEEERTTLAKTLHLNPDEIQVERADDSPGPGNAITITLAHEHASNVFSSFGRRGLGARRGATNAADAAQRFRDTGVPVDPHLADQLLLPMALLGGGRMRLSTPSQHTRTNLDVLRSFGLSFEQEEISEGVWEIALRA